MASHIHIVSKADIKEHRVIQLPSSSLKPLQDGHVRVRSVLLALTSNTLSYARMGSILKWWETYPVPADLPAPYNDQTHYGICPTWGYAEVVESKISGMKAGTLIWGFWPSSELPVDLELVPAKVAGHWIETSEQRKNLMNIYQRYKVPDPSARLASLSPSNIEDMAWQATCLVWEAGYVLNSACFTSPAIHPMGSGDWTEKDANLSSTVVISLSASGKTARAFTHALINHRSPGMGPLGLLAITSMSNHELIPKASFSTSTVSYQTSTDTKTMDWIAQLNPKRIVIANFGGRGNSQDKLLEALEKYFEGNMNVMTVSVGSDAQMTKQEQLVEFAKTQATVKNRVQMNTSPIKDVLLEREGEEAFFREIDEAWEGFIKGDSMKDLKLELRNGIEGDDSFEGGWTKLTDGKVPGDVALAYKLF